MTNIIIEVDDAFVRELEAKAKAYNESVSAFAGRVLRKAVPLSTESESAENEKALDVLVRRIRALGPSPDIILGTGNMPNLDPDPDDGDWRTFQQEWQIVESRLKKEQLAEATDSIRRDFPSL